MEKNGKFKYLFIGGVLALALFFAFGFSTDKCEGVECDSSVLEEGSNQAVTYAEYPEMVPELLAEKVANDEVYLLDVRELSEWNAGYIQGASLVPLGELSEETAKDFPKDKSIYIYCRSGRRAGEAVKTLEGLGFDNAINIGGINHYLERGGTLVK